MLRLKVGDIAVLHVEVVEVIREQWFRHKALDGVSTSPLVPQSLIKEILPRPPEVGDIVWWDAGSYYKASSHWGMTLIHIHQVDNRKWAICSYQGDIPYSVPFEAIRKTPGCVDS